MKTDQVIKQIQDLNGNIAAVARKLGVTRQSVYNHIRQHPTVQEALQQARETMLDNAESVLYREVLDGNMTAVIFFLKTQGRTRGYVERQELAGVKEQPLTIRIIDDDSSDPTDD